MADPWRYWWVTHIDLDVMNPMSSGKLDRVVERMALPRGARVVDIASGKGELLFRLAERYGASGTGVDTSPYNIRAGRGMARRRQGGERLSFVRGDGAKFRTPRPLDGAFCVGATWVWGGFRGTARALSSMTKPGGVVVIGHPFWANRPSATYLRAEDMKRSDFGTRAKDAAAARAEGLRVAARLTSTKSEWHQYESSQWRAAARFDRDHPEDPLAPVLTRRVAKSRRSYLAEGRRCLGWTLWVLVKEKGSGPEGPGK